MCIAKWNNEIEVKNLKKHNLLYEAFIFDLARLSPEVEAPLGHILSDCPNSIVGSDLLLHRHPVNGLPGAGAFLPSQGIRPFPALEGQVDMRVYRQAATDTEGRPQEKGGRFGPHLVEVYPSRKILGYDSIVLLNNPF